MDIRVLRLAGLSFIVLSLLAGCASAPSETSPSDGSAAGIAPPSPLELARAEVAQAQAAGYDVEDAVIFLRRAEQAAAAGDEKATHAAAGQARRAVEARKAIEAARPEVEKAMRDAGPLASDAGKFLEAAEAALKAGDPVRALELAAQARRQAGAAVEQQRAESTRAAEGEPGHYQVARGDSLWSISAGSQIYGDPLLWPLLFKSNRERIKDADLIYPGQGLTIDRNPGKTARQAATRHARTRGPWKKGAVESSDRAYLGR